jgi:RNA recognition motif-containing protein
MAVRLFVGNLPYSATEVDLRQHFAAVGPLSYVYLPTDRETGKPRGFAFIEFNERSHAEEAIRRFNSQSFMGRTIAVNEARAKDDRPAPSGPSSRPAPRAFTPMSGDPPPSEAPARNFGPDAAPRRSRKSPKGSPKGERAPKKPIRERPGGQMFLGGDDDDFDEDDLGDNFASREHQDSEDAE